MKATYSYINFPFVCNIILSVLDKQYAVNYFLLSYRCLHVPIRAKIHKVGAPPPFRNSVLPKNISEYLPPMGQIWENHNFSKRVAPKNWGDW